jgi:hypothetical protein
LEQLIPTVVQMYDKKQEDILEVAKAVDLPPVTAFRFLFPLLILFFWFAPTNSIPNRTILIGRDMTAEQIEQVMQIREKSQFLFLSKRDNEQLEKAKKNDVVCRGQMEGDVETVKKTL